MNKKTICFVFVALLIGICVPMPGNNTSFIPIVSAGGDCPTTEAELEADLTDVNDVYTNNDFADNSANWNTAFGWGDHSTQNYFDKDTDLLDEPLLDCDNAPTDEYVLSYESTTGNFEWKELTASNPFDQDLNTFNWPSFADLDIEGGVYHSGDSNTVMDFVSDRIFFTVGGYNYLDMKEAATDEIIINEAGIDCNLRYESDTNTYALFFDAFANRFGVLDSTPDRTLDVGGDIQLDDDLFVGDDIELMGTSNEITTDDSDGSDNSYTSISGGGDDSYTRGACIKMYGNEALQNGDMYLYSGDDDIELYAGNTKVMTIENSYNHVGIYSETTPYFAVECINQNSADGKMRAYSFPTYSDMRFKTAVIENLPKNMVKSFCENVSSGIWIFALHDTYQDDNGTIFNLGVNYSNLDFGIPAQHLYNWLNNTDRFGQYAERLANTVVYKPQDETIDYWSVDYESVSLIFAKYTSFLNDDIIQLREDATKEIAKNRFHIKALENWASQFGYNPPPWN